MDDQKSTEQSNCHINEHNKYKRGMLAQEAYRGL